MNSFGHALRVTTFGESHGVAIGCVVDGVPAGLTIDEEFVQCELDKRKPGQNAYSTPRKENDTAKILSGVFEGLSTGQPIAIVIYNENQKSSDYSEIANMFRPGHADFTYMAKYGLRDYRGGGRSSARETAARVAAGAIAKLILRELGIIVEYGLCGVGEVSCGTHDFAFASTSEIFALSSELEVAMKEEILKAKNAHDSVGGCVAVRVVGAPAGLGEPLYGKLDSAFAEAMMGINGVKAVEIGAGVEVSRMRGSENNDAIRADGFVTNHSGGILGGVSNGDEITLKVHFKPTPSIFLPQQTITKDGEEATLSLKGRHDPCIAARGAVVAGAMAALVVADALLSGMGAKMEHLKKVWKNG
jgi:chorismate synthase